MKIADSDFHPSDSPPARVGGCAAGRTLGTGHYRRWRTRAFQARSFDRSDTSPSSGANCNLNRKPTRPYFRNTAIFCECPVF